MKDSGAGTNGSAQSAKPMELATISERKLKANRENPRKSTGHNFIEALMADPSFFSVNTGFLLLSQSSSQVQLGKPRRLTFI
jgi:hypothetical protein